MGSTDELLLRRQDESQTHSGVSHDMTTNSPHFEQSFSDDGGKTWEVNFITDQTRVKDECDEAH